MQWLQNPNQSNVDNVNNISHEASRHFRNKNKECQKTKIIDPETNSKNRMSEACIGASVTLRRVTRLEHNE